MEQKEQNSSKLVWRGEEGGGGGGWREGLCDLLVLL